MSSIMRCRSGLMALSVMRDAPVLMEVANPSSQDRTPRSAIVSALSPAAAPYRASGLVLWHKRDVPTPSSNVRVYGHIEKHILVLISPHFVKVCGWRPHEGGAAHTGGAGVRKPP